MIQDYMLFLLAYHIVFTGYAWGVWGLLACSLLSPPPISFGSTLTLTLALPIVIVVGSLVGSPVGLGEFEVNSGCFSLLLVGTYWWLVYLLPLLGQQALSLILAPTRSPNDAYCQGHTVHTFPRHRQKFGVFVTYSTHVIVLIFVRSLLSVTPPHPINELIVNDKNSMVNLRQDISSHLLQEVSTVSWDHGVLKISSEMSLAPPIVVHASLLQVVLAWCKRLSFYVCGWWTKPSIPCCPSKVDEDNHEWNAVVNTFLSDHDPSRVMDFYQIFDRISEGVHKNWDGVSGGGLMRSSIDAGLSLSKGMVGFQQKSLWSEILCYLGATTSTNSCHISFLDIPRCFQSIVNNNSLLIIDSGASVCITPH